MERNELVTAVILVVVSLVLGFALYSVFFHPLTGELRARYKGGRERFWRWLKEHARRIILILVLVAAGLGLLIAGLRFGGAVVERVKALIPARQSEAESTLPPMAAEEPGMEQGLVPAEDSYGGSEADSSLEAVTPGELEDAAGSVNAAGETGFGQPGEAESGSAFESLGGAEGAEGSVPRFDTLPEQPPQAETNRTGGQVGGTLGFGEAGEPR